MEVGIWRSRPATPGRPFVQTPPRSADSLQRWALVSLAAGLTVAVVRVLVPFEHGIWLVAYLLLVGFLAPALLGAGEVALFDRDSGETRNNRQAALWAFGTVAVPSGVLADSRLGVVLGSVALLIVLVAMGSAVFVVAASRIRPRRTALVWGQLGLVAFMAVSVGVGLLLSWDNPWL